MYLIAIYALDLGDISVCSEYKSNTVAPQNTVQDTTEISMASNEMCVLGQLQVGKHQGQQEIEKIKTNASTTTN